MPFYDENSWKKKIDPAFDKPVKTFIKYLSEIDKLPDDGQVAFEEEFIELISKTPNLLVDNKNGLKSEMFRFIKNVGLVTEHQSKVLLNTSYTVDKYSNLLMALKNGSPRITISRFFKILYLRFGIQRKISLHMHSLRELAENIPEEESKQYYAKKINVFIKDIRTKHFALFQKDFVSILLSIFIRFSFYKIDEIKEKNVVEEDVEGKEHLKNPIVINTVIGFLYSTFSQIAHQKDLCDLLDNAVKGDDKSLFKAITIDKTLIGSEYVKNRIALAQASGDKKFLKKLSKATEKGPLESVGEHGITYAVLNFFWNNIELYKLNNQELYYFLKSCGINPPAYQDAFDKFMQRHIKKK